MYITYEEFSGCNPTFTVQEFQKYSFRAERILDDFTTGVDGVHKLRIAFPTRGIDRASVITCLSELIDILKRIDTSEAEQTISTEHPHGAVASISSGSESVSYVSSGSSAFNAAVGSLEARRKLLSDTVNVYLRNAQDANGVNLLYMGAYPACTRI